MSPEERYNAIDGILNRLTVRHEALTERHEALAQTVELLTTDVQQDTANIRALARNALTLHDSIKALESIATAHDHRIERLEGQ